MLIICIWASGVNYTRADFVLSKKICQNISFKTFHCNIEGDKLLNIYYIYMYIFYMYILHIYIYIYIYNIYRHISIDIQATDEGNE